MRNTQVFACVLVIALIAVSSCAHADNITDTGPGSFADIINDGILDYVLLNGNASIGNITNSNNGTLNGNDSPIISAANLGNASFNLGLSNATITGDITNNGAISQMSADNNAAGILITGSSIGGNIINNGTVTGSTTSWSNKGAGIYIDTNVNITGGIINSGTIMGTSSIFGSAYGIYNFGTITDGIVNSGTITATSGAFGNAYGIYDSGIIAGGITNTGTITATAGFAGTGYAICHQGSALTINQNAGSISGNIQLSGNGDTLNINGGMVTGSIYGGNADAVNLTGGTLTLTSNEGINSIGAYTQGADGSLVLQISANGSSGFVNAHSINLGGDLVVSPQGSGFGLVQTYSNIILSHDAGLTGSFASVTSDTAQYVPILTADGSNGYDLALIQPGLVNSSNIIDIGPGSFADINNVATLNYVALINGNIGNITNSSNETINGNNPTTISTISWGNAAFNIGLYNVTVTDSITNNGTISQTNTNNNVAGVLVTRSNIGGNIVNNGTITVSSPNNSAAGIFIDDNSNVSGSIINGGTITASPPSYSNAIGIINYGAITGGITNSGTIAATTSSSNAIGIINYSTITDGITNSGTITATATDGGTAWAIDSDGSAIIINQNLGAINGSIGLSGADTFNINGGTVAGSIIGNQRQYGGGGTDLVNLAGGTLALSPTNNVSSIGTFTQGPGGILALGVTPNTAATISATTISLNGTLRIVPSGTWTPGMSISYLDVINASGSLSGTFATIITPTLFTARVTPDGPNALDLSVTEASATANNLITGLVGNNNSPAAQNLVSSLEGMSQPQLQHAVIQLTGPGIAQSIQAVRSISGDVSGTVQQRLLTGGNYDTSDLMSLSMVGSHMQMSLADGPVPRISQTQEYGLWMRSFGGFATGAGQNGMAGFNQSRGGAILGLDQKLDDDWTLGGAVQYAHTAFSLDDNSASSTADSYNGIVYGGWRQSQLYVNGTIGVGLNDYDSSRTLGLGSYTSSPTSSFSGQSYAASVETGYALSAEEWIFTPYAGLDYAYNHTNGFTEQGDGVSNLIVQPGASNSLLSTVGARAGTTFDLPGIGTFMPEAHVAWQHENLDESQNVNVALVSNPGNVFSVTGPEYGRNSALTGLALSEQLTENSRLFLTYDAKLNGGYTEQVLSGGFRMEF